MTRAYAVRLLLLSVLPFGPVGLALGGNITVEGPSGMFLNPTADERPANTLLPQACWLHQDLGPGSFNGVLGMTSYTLPSRTEVGGLVFVADFPGGNSETAVGGFVRQILIHDNGRRPSVAVGGVLLQGDPLTRKSLFAALRKRVTPERAAIPIYADVGAKWVFAADNDDATVYGGVEVGLLDSLSLVGEVAHRTKFEVKTPYAAGIQYTWNERLGLSLAAVNPGNGGDTGLFFGIGYAYSGH